MRRSAVHEAALTAGLAVETPERFKAPEVMDAFAALSVDCAIVVAYGQILPQAALDAPRLGCLNLHASLLPRWRGAAPIQRAIMAGDRETGVGVMQMEAGLDTGPVLAEARTPIGPEDTAATLHDRLAAIGPPLLIETLARLDRGPVIARDQPAQGVTYAHKITKAEARIDWTQPARVVDCHIRGLSPFPGAWFELNGERIKCLMSAMGAGQGSAGHTLDDTLTVACGEGAVKLLSVQRAGRSGGAVADFLRGFPVPEGTRLA